MKVKDLLASKGRDVATISQERSVTDGLTPPLVGIFSERDVVRALASHGAEALDLTVAELMSSDVTVCDEATSVTTLMGLMTDNRIRHIPVVDDGRLAGLISIGDVVKARFDELEHDKKDLLDYVSAR